MTAQVILATRDTRRRAEHGIDIGRARTGLRYVTTSALSNRCVCYASASTTLRCVSNRSPLH